MNLAIRVIYKDNGLSFSYRVKMLHNFPNTEFLENLRDCCSTHALNVADVEKRGNEGVIVMTPDSVIKIYASTRTKRGINAFTREQNALLVLGGHDHEHFVIPELKSSGIFKKPFDLLGASYGAMTEQSRLNGEQPALETREEQFKLGSALGEFHQFLKAKTSEGIASFGNLLHCRLAMMTEKMDEKSLLKPSARKRLVQDIQESIAESKHQQLVHGDFRPGNFLWDNEADKFGILDLTTIGDSVPEQDLAHLVHLPKEKLTAIFNGYKETTDYKPKLKTAQKLHLLDIAVAMNCAQASGNGRGAENLRNRFDVVWAATYHDGEIATCAPTRAVKMDPAPL